MNLETLRKEADTRGGQISASYMQLFSTSIVKMNMKHGDSLPVISVTNNLMGVNPTCCWNVDPLMPSGYIITSQTKLLLHFGSAELPLLSDLHISRFCP